jgi:hypothetical protein
MPTFGLCRISQSFGRSQWIAGLKLVADAA